MDKIKKIFFICTNNTFLSPMAEAVYRNSFETGMPEAVSRGIVVLFPEPISPKVNLILSGHEQNICNHENTRQLEKDEISDGSYVFTMTLSEKVKVMEEYEIKNVYTLGEFTGLNIDIPDPYGGEGEQYENSAAIIFEAVKILTDKIKAINGGTEMIGLGSDHGGYALKQEIKGYLDQNNIPYKDYGCFDENPCDYPVYAKLVANAVVSGECDKGILICGTGIGISIAANKVKGIRAALCHDVFSAEATRLHNDANILAMGGRVVGAGLALKIVDTFINTEFSDEERHKRRISQIEEN